MIRHKHIDIICIVICIAALLLTGVLINYVPADAEDTKGTYQEYEDKLFDDEKVHTIDIQMDDIDWQSFLNNASSEEYTLCDVVIDGDTFKNVAIRAKGNSSLSTVSQYNSQRYSLKIEFDHYNAGETYYGLDKLSLNNIIQDSTYMKDYVCYHLMNDMGVPSPLSSFVNVKVNGKTFGLYIAAEGIEESFLTRNYGSVDGKLYKPDSFRMGSKKAKNGANDDFQKGADGFGGDMPKDVKMPTAGNMPDNSSATNRTTSDDAAKGNQSGGFGGNMPNKNNSTSSGDSSSTNNDVNNGLANGGFGFMSKNDSSTLVYINDDPDSYSTIWDGSIFDINSSDKKRLISSLKQLNSGENLDKVVNIDEVLKYFVVHNFVLNFDSYTSSMTHNYYLYEQNGVLSMLPWDYNLAFGGMVMGIGNSGAASTATSLVNFPIDTPFSNATLDERPILGKLLENDEYMKLYHKYFNEFITDYFESGKFEKFIDKTEALIDSYVKDDPTAFCEYDDFKTAVSTLKKFCSLRAESIRGQLNGTIPSTTGGQEKDSSKLIDASDINISDMGSNAQGANHGNMQQGGNSSPNSQEPQNSSLQSQSSKPQSSSSQPVSAAVTAQTGQVQTTTLAAGTSESVQRLSAQSGNSDGIRAKAPHIVKGENSNNTANQPNNQNQGGGFSPPDMQQGGFSPPDMQQGGFSPPDMQQGGESSNTQQSSGPSSDNNNNFRRFGQNWGGKDFKNQNGTIPSAKSSANGSILYELILLGSCVVVLVGGMIFVRKYRK